MGGGSLGGRSFVKKSWGGEKLGGGERSLGGGREAGGREYNRLSSDFID